MSLPTLSHSLPPSQKLPQTLLVLVGLIGSGKSSLANALEQDLGWMRCNQDELQGDRRLVEKKVRAGLSQGLNVVVDRTNFDPQQRAHFLNIASDFPKVQKWALFLDVPLPLCLSRLSTRTNHPTITSFSQAQQVLLKFSSQLRVPTPSEGFDRVLHLTDLVPLEIPRAFLEELVGRIEKEGERQTLWSRSQWGGGGQGNGNGFGNVGGGGGGRGGYGGGGGQGQGQGGGYRGGGQGTWHGGGGGGAETRRSDSAGSWR